MDELQKCDRLKQLKTVTKGFPCLGGFETASHVRRIAKRATAEARVKRTFAS